MTDTFTARTFADALRDTVREMIGDNFLPAFLHEDGSWTVPQPDEFGDPAFNPRDTDMNIATLVQCDNDRMGDVDKDADGSIGDARDRWGWTELTGLVGAHRSDRAVKAVGRDGMVRRYLAMFRPDILAYDEWQVSGYSQGDWAGGYAYVTREAYEEHQPNATPAECIVMEANEYEKYFRGDVFGLTVLRQGEAIVHYGAEGAYVEGYIVDEESVWGYLGDPDASIVPNVNASPIVATEWF